MKSLKLNSRLIRGSFFVVLMTFGLIFSEASWGADKADKKNLAGLSSVNAYQIGDADLVITLKGKQLPKPELVFNGNTATLTFKDTKADKSALKAIQAETAVMLESYKTEQISDDVVISLVTETPVQLNSVRGVAPSNSYTLRLITTERQQKIQAAPQATYQPKTPKVPTGPFASDAKITLDLRDTELRDVFRMLGVHMNKNIIIDPSLPPELVTMTLRDVPLSEAYTYLMKKYDISYEFIGKDTMLIGTSSGLAKIAGKEETRVFHVAYADTAVMTTILPNLTRITPQGLAVDDRLKNIYVTSTPDILEEIAIVLQRLDHPGRQVMLQARILEFTDNAELEVENAVNAVYDHWWFSYAGQDGGRGGYVDDNRRGRDYSYSGNNAAIAPYITDITTPMQGIWREFDAAINAIEKKDNGRSLATPSIIAVDGEEASINLTTNQPVPSGKDDNGITYSDKAVGPQLKLTPRIGRDGIVTIALDIKTGEIIGEVTTPDGPQPISTERDVKTSVRVRNGEPFVVGGLFSDNKSKNTVRIPILGSIPLLGELFTYRHNNTHKTQVVIVIVPFILDIPDVAIEQERVMFR
ncbi:type II and III secretion system protein [Synergistales bacterium]|nr:type II and III secretion system protein [Synergistales bacterium]